MKTTQYICTLVLALLTFSYSFGQESPFKIHFETGLGWGTVKANDFKLNSSTMPTSLLLNYSLGAVSLESGLSFATSSADLVIPEIGSRFTEFYTLSIPLGINTALGFGDMTEEGGQQPIYLLAGLGLSANHLMKAKVKDFYNESGIGWNFGSYGRVGIMWHVNKSFSLAMGLRSDSDFSKISKKGLNDFKQTQNSVFLNMGLRL